MYDINEIGHSIKYVAAEKINQSFMQQITLISFLLWVTFRVLVQSFPLIFKVLYRFVYPKQLKNLNGKIALITGGGNGLGRAIAFQLAKENCNNIIIADIDFESAERTAEEIKSIFCIKCKAYRADVSDYEGIEKLKEEIKKDFGIVNILVNNAGIVPSTSLCNGNWKDIDKVMKVNIGSNIWPTLIFMEDMIKQKDGHIVAIASIAGLVSVPHLVAYATSKHAVVGFITSLADQLHIDGHNTIKTTCICPYVLNTRKDYVALADLKFPPIEAEYAAKKVVSAIRKEKELEIITIGSCFFNILRIIPSSIRRLWMKILLNPKQNLACFK